MTSITSLSEAYEVYRCAGTEGSGLAWYLAAEFCARFYASHGIVPHVLEHEGLGYYGIALDRVPCAINGDRSQRIGRFTAGGDVENWITGSPGDHGLQLADRAAQGEQLSHLLSDAIRYLQLPSVPERSHTACRHKRYGQSYAMIFTLAALLSIRHQHRIQVWNDSWHAQGVAGYDPKSAKKDDPGPFLFIAHEARVLIESDGRVILPSGKRSVWERYMSGETESDLMAWLTNHLRLSHTGCHG